MTNPVRRLVPWWVLALLFVALPVTEIYLLIQVGQAIGGLWTVALLLASGIAGAWLVKHEGSRAWRALQEALVARRMPARELADGALILIGGTLLLTPGFITDLVGAFAVLPFTRSLARSAPDPGDHQEVRGRRRLRRSHDATTPRHRRVGGPGRGHQRLSGGSAGADLIRRCGPSSCWAGAGGPGRSLRRAAARAAR